MEKILPKIEVLQIRAVNSDSPLKAFASVQIGLWTIREWRIIQQSGQRAWVSPPQVSWKNEEGKTCYKRIITLPEELKRRIDAVILLAWEKENLLVMEEENE